MDKGPHADLNTRRNTKQNEDKRHYKTHVRIAVPNRNRDPKAIQERVLVVFCKNHFIKTPERG